MKRLLNRYAYGLLTLAFGGMVFLFWRLRYPFALVYQEQFQLFLYDWDYLYERMAEPGGFARYVAEFLVQFYNSVTIGAAIVAGLYMLVQRLTWRLTDSEGHYALSFIPAVMLWYAMGDESVMLTYVTALIMAMAVALAWRRWSGKRAQWVKWVSAMLIIPVTYWLIGPMVLLTAVLMTPWLTAGAAAVYSLALILLSTHCLPFPMMRVVTGIGYYRLLVTLPYILILIPAGVWLLVCFGNRLPKARRWVNAVEVMLVLVVMVQLVELGYDKKKYELIEYDYLVRIRDWKGIIAKAEKQTPDLPMSVSATNLALAMTNQLGDRAFEFYQRGSEGLLPLFERNFATTQLSGEVYFYLGMINTAQRFAFEAMEAIPDYNKSGRAIKRLAETNLINGQYEVARKYLRMLEKTIFYRPWARQTMAMLGDEKQIDAHPLYGTLRQYRLEDDFLFSEDELDKICGQLFMHNHHNQMATQYLVMAPLLDGDAQRFINYVSYVQSKVNYNPRYVREAIAKIRRMK